MLEKSHQILYYLNICRAFTDSALAFLIVLLNAAIDLISFASILYSIYPPLFIDIILYAAVGTAVSVFIGKNLVFLNFR